MIRVLIALMLVALTACGKREMPVQPQEPSPPKVICVNGWLFMWDVAWGKWELTGKECKP